MTRTVANPVIQNTQLSQLSALALVIIIPDKIDLSLISIIALQQNPNLENQLLLMQLSNLLPQQQQLATLALPPTEPLTTTFEVSF